MGRYIPQREWDAISRMTFTPSELRLDRLEREYLFALAMAKNLVDKFAVAGDEACRLIAFNWYATLKAHYSRAHTMQESIREGKRADRIAARHGKAGR